MKVKFSIVSFLLALTVLFTNVSCDKNKVEYDDPVADVKKEIGSTEPETSKKQSKKTSVYFDAPDTYYRKDMTPDRLAVYFSNDVCPIEMKDKEQTEGITINPAIDGTWKWEGLDTLVFYPSKRWELNQKYKVTFSDKIFEKGTKLSGDLSFSTQGFSAGRSTSDFYINPLNSNEKKATFDIEASHPIDRASFEKAVKLTLVEQTNADRKNPLKKNLGFTVNYGEDDTKAYIISDNIPIPEYTSSVELSVTGFKSSWGGNASSEISGTVSVPGMRDFVRFEDANFTLVKKDNLEYEQVFIIETKGKVSASEILNRMNVFLLPKDRPAEQGWEEVKDVRWTGQRKEYFTSKVKSLSKRVTAEIVPSAEEYSTANMFRVSVPEDKYLAVEIKGKVNFFGGYRIDADELFYLYTNKFPREIGIVSDGALLALGGSKKIAMYSRGIDSVEYTLSRIMPKDVNHLVSMSNGDIKNLSFDSYRFNEKNISETEVKKYTIPDSSVNKVSYFSYDFSPDLVTNSSKNLSKGLFIFKVSNPKTGKYDRRFILVTDLGLVVKRNENGSRDIFVMSVSKGTPVSGAKVKIVGLNGNSVLETYTDGSGHAKFPALSSKETDKPGHKPVAFVVETGNDLSFMPYQSYGRYVDYSNYDVGGVYDYSGVDKIESYLFSDRGIYRPGEKVNIGIISKSGNWARNLSGIPVELTVTDSQGKDFFSKQFMLGSEGFNEVTFATQPYSATGVYNINFYLVKTNKEETWRDYLAGTTVKVEEFLPDTLNVSSTFDPLPNSGWISLDKELKGIVKVKNLFGTPAANNEVKARINLTPGLPYVQRYRGYRFNDPYSKNNYYEESLDDMKTDEEGSAVYDIDLSKFEKASYRLNLYAEAFEKGSGRNVSTSNNIYISPLKYIIGYKADGDLGFINKNSKRKISFVAVDQNLQDTKVSGVTLRFQERTYISTLVKQNNGLYKYQSVEKLVPVSEEKITIEKGGTDLFLPVENPGEFIVTVLDADGVEFNKFTYNVAGTGTLKRNLTRTAELEINLDKKDFNNGEEAQIYIRAPYKGTGLITIEKDKVYQYKWFKQDDVSSVQKITIPSDLEGNGYINVMFKRDLDSDEIFMSPFCYGAVPFSVSRASKTENITLNVPAEIKSGTELKVKYSTEHKSKIILIGVDEGILQTANYKTPDPLSFFFKKRALQVSTAQILDLILPEYNVLQTSMATGGGADMDMFKKKLNPFKRKVSDSVVFWSGIINSSSEEKEYVYNVPDYFNGTIRIMAVAVNDRAIGVEESYVTATNTFVIQPNSPLAVAPGDEFDLTVNVTNLNKGSKGVVVLKAEPDNHVEISGNKTLELKIPEGGDSLVTFKVKAKPNLGGAEIKFTATEKGTTESSVITQTFSVRPSLPYQNRIKSGRINNGKAVVDIDRKVYDDLSKRFVYASVVPTTFKDGLEIYLADYPYGCSEQVTSKAYPYIFRNFIAKDKTQAETDEMIAETVAILQSRQKPNGHIGYWTDSSTENEFITLYVAEFITDARANGFNISSSFYEKTLGAVRDIAYGSFSTVGKNTEDGIYNRAYAAYILTKNDITTTTILEGIVKDASAAKVKVDGYTGLYLAACYKMLMVDKQADEMLNKVNRKITFSKSSIYHNSLEFSSLYVTIVSKYFPDRIKLLKKEMLDDMVSYLEYANYNTLSVAYGLRALSALEEATTGDKEFYEARQIEGSGKTAKTTKIDLSKTLVGTGTFSRLADQIEVEKKAELPVYFMVLNGGYGLENPTVKTNVGIEIYREYLKPDGSKLTSFKKGDEVLVRLTYKSLDGYMPNIAIIDMLPAFLETDTPSIRSSERSVDYVDVREDRNVIFTNFSSDSRTFEYKARVINSGKFNVPPAFAESMYNPEVYSLYPYDPITVAE